MHSNHRKASNDQLTVWLVISPLVIAAVHVVGLFVNTRLLKGSFLPFSYFLSFIGQYLLYWVIQLKLGHLKPYWPIMSYSLLLIFGVAGFVFFGDTRFLFECLAYIGIGYIALVLHRMKALSSGLTVGGIQAVSVVVILSFTVGVYRRTYKRAGAEIVEGVLICTTIGVAQLNCKNKLLFGERCDFRSPNQAACERYSEHHNCNRARKQT